jgi:hypothetical protein
MAITLKRTLLIAGAPVALASILGGSVAFASQLGSGNAERESFDFSRSSHRQEPPSDGDGTDKDGCPHDRGGSESSLSDQT